MKWIIVTLIFILLATTTLAGTYKTYIVDDTPRIKSNNMLTFEVSHGRSKTSSISCIQRLKKSRRNYNNKLFADKEKYTKCLKEVTKNWKTDTLPESHQEYAVIKGFDKTFHKRFARDLWFKIRKGEDCPKRISY